MIQISKWLKLAIIIIVVFVVSCVALSIYNSEGETKTYQGVLLNVGYKDDESYTLTFQDGFTVTLKTDDKEDTLDFIQYMEGWINQEIIIEYRFYFDMGGYEMDSVKGVD